MRMFGYLILSSAAAFASADFWSPLNPPRATYVLEARVSSDGSRLDGSEAVRFTNNTPRPIGRVAFLFDGGDLRLRANGAAAERITGVKHPALFELPRDIAPGESVELVADWVITHEPIKDGEGIATSSWYPRLWWGFETLADYQVKLEAPAGLTVLAGGKSQNGVILAPGTRALGIFAGKGFQTASAAAGSVPVTIVFTPKGSECAHLLLKTAVDAIGYYQDRFGYYPQNSLTIVPGGDYPAGGYPVATAMVAVHGQERMKEKPDDWWRWITAHEIGHMYWSEHVLAQGPDSLNWLMIGLGIHADREYRRTRGIKEAGELWRTYITGVEQGYDTTMDLTAAQEKSVQWDFNNVVVHGKSSAALNAIESVIGLKTFDAVYRRCLGEYAGKRLGWREFQHVAEQESGQDLDWFFERWARSPEYAGYRIAGQACSNGYCTVRIQKTGSMYMPVTVAARFEDGTEQRAVTERLADEEVLRFRSEWPLKTVVIEPDSAVVLAQPLPDLLDRIRALPWTGAGGQALALFQQALAGNVKDEGAWIRLAMALYDGRHYLEALTAFGVSEKSEEPVLHFMGLVWQGHILDLLGKRSEAVEKYKAALKVPGTPRMKHDQYGMTIDKQWVEERLTAPFTRQ